MKPTHCSLPPEFFSANRAKLAEALPRNSVCAVFSGEHHHLSWDQHYPFRVDKNFFYLCGINEPGCTLLLTKGEGEAKEFLFIPEVDSEAEKWTGKMLSAEQAQKASSIKAVLPKGQFEAKLVRTAQYAESLHTVADALFTKHPAGSWHLFLEELKRRLPGLTVKSLFPLLSQMRAAKTDSETALIKASLKLTSEALYRVACAIRPGVQEHQIEADIKHQYQYGGHDSAFDPIVAGGVNATVLHYTRACSELKDGDLVLVDTGAASEFYCGDMTRVFPVSGKFSARQRQLHDANIEILSDVIAMLRPGMTMTEVQERSAEIQERVLRREGIIAEDAKAAPVTLHSIGHSLGLDVHDPCAADIPLPEGFIMTVEPGIYLPEEGIGIRNEDVVRLRSNGAELLTDFPRTTDEIERLMREVQNRNAQS